MKSITLTPNLIQLTKMGMMNAYLVREEDGFTLVDTTVSAADDIIAAAAAAGAPIKRIALTHAHGDHVGSVDALREQLGADIPVLMPEIDAKISAGAPVQEPAKKRGSWPTLKTTPDTLLAAGDHVGSLEVVATPGHTPGHVAFVDTRDRAVIAGDSLSNIGGLSVPNHLHWRFPLPYLASGNRPQTLDSAKVVRSLKPSLLVVGHGGAVKQPIAQIDAAIATAQSKQKTA